MKHSEIEKYLFSILEDQLNEDEKDNLIQELASSAEFQTELADQIFMDTLLKFREGSLSSSDPLLERIYAYIEQKEEVPSEPVSSRIQNRRRAFQKTGWWAISLGLHAACILFVAIFLVFPPEKTDYEPAFRLSHGKVKNYGYVKKMHNIDNTYTGLGSPGPLEEDIGLEISRELNSDDLVTPHEIDLQHKSEDFDPSVSELNIKKEYWAPPIDDFGTGFSFFKIRNGINRKKALIRYGGSQATEAAVLAALKWFKRHQARDGSWSFEDYHNECKLDPECKHVDEALTRGHVAGLKKKRYLENAATGFALLCYLGAGHTHNTGKFRKQVADGISFLMKAQKPDGSFSPGNYVHSVTAMAVIEAYGMTKSPLLKESAQKAVDVILARQNNYMGWDYERQSARNDTSITGWNVMALKSAKFSGIDIKDRFDGVKRLLDKVTPEIKAGDNPKLLNHVAYQHIKGKDSAGHRNSTLTSIGMLCRVFIGEDIKRPMLRAHANMMLEEIPKDFDEANLFQVYYATLAMFQMGNGYWNEWNKAIKKVLCENQRKGGCAEGSWYIEKPVWYNQVGRLFHTAMGCLTLEVYYRYIPFVLRNDLGDIK